MSAVLVFMIVFGLILAVQIALWLYNLFKSDKLKVATNATLATWVVAMLTGPIPGIGLLTNARCTAIFSEKPVSSSSDEQ